MSVKRFGCKTLPEVESAAGTVTRYWIQIAMDNYVGASMRREQLASDTQGPGQDVNVRCVCVFLLHNNNVGTVNNVSFADKKDARKDATI